MSMRISCVDSHASLPEESLQRVPLRLAMRVPELVTYHVPQLVTYHVLRVCRCGTNKATPTVLHGAHRRQTD